MPHKKNPDVFQLIRARFDRIQSLPNEIRLITSNLPSVIIEIFRSLKKISFLHLRSLIIAFRLQLTCLEDKSKKQLIER
ncbi:argininosuccinate lyase [Sporocytophaga myxococcoides]|uniref:Argininosuccinate lyase n=1 Tax=Sporocytophaga myxococcoides TaxID=153721 RepID=A0A098LBY7_9BACT|nr:argininosuccinate lyase [Sporocytophaga myxococcoides]